MAHLNRQLPYRDLTTAAHHSYQFRTHIDVEDSSVAVPGEPTQVRQSHPWELTNTSITPPDFGAHPSGLVEYDPILGSDESIRAHINHFPTPIDISEEEIWYVRPCLPLDYEIKTKGLGRDPSDRTVVIGADHKIPLYPRLILHVTIRGGAPPQPGIVLLSFVRSDLPDR